MLRRDFSSLDKQQFDAVILGGGIQGACVSLSLAARGLRPLLLEKRDFGSGASSNSLRIVHGGLRYLQSMDLPRFFSSIAARRWFLRHFPDLVEPLPCLMPLPGQGLKRASIMRLALGLNDSLSLHRNKGVRSDRAIPAARVHRSPELAGLVGGIDIPWSEHTALWYDATMSDSARLLMELLHWAEAHGAVHCNYVHATGVRTAGNSISGIAAYDSIDDIEFEVRTPIVINATGADVQDVTSGLEAVGGPDVSYLWAWNILLNRPATTNAALAITAPGNGHTYFLRPWKGWWLLGTGQAPISEDQPGNAEALITNMLNDVNAALPEWCIKAEDVKRIFAGYLPAASPGSTALRKWPKIVDHARCGGPSGFISISTVKLTTAAQIAERVAGMIAGQRRVQLGSRPPAMPITDLAASWNYEDPPSLSELQGCVDWKETAINEQVVFIDDLLLRRTPIGDDTSYAEKAALPLMQSMGWELERQNANNQRLNRLQYYVTPS